MSTGIFRGPTVREPELNFIMMKLNQTVNLFELRFLMLKRVLILSGINFCIKNGSSGLKIPQTNTHMIADKS